MNVSAQGIFPSLPCPNPKYCACPGIGYCLPIVANDELFENILLIPIWLISVYMICTVSLRHCLTVKLDDVIWRDFWFASKSKTYNVLVWQYSSESEKKLKRTDQNGLAGYQRSSRWLLLDYWLPANSSNRSRWRKKVRGFAACNSRRITRPPAVGNRTTNFNLVLFLGFLAWRQLA